MSLLSPPVSTQDPVIASPPADLAASRSVSKHIQPRSSIMATIALALGAGSVFTVATGVLAVPGATLGLLAALFGIGGIRGTRQRHIAGTGNAVIALVAGLVAVVAGVLAATGVVPGFDTDTDNIARLHGWLDAHAPWALPKF